MGYFWETAVCDLARSAGWHWQNGRGPGTRLGNAGRDNVDEDGPGERPLANPRWVEGGMEGGVHAGGTSEGLDSPSALEGGVEGLQNLAR